MSRLPEPRRVSIAEYRARQLVLRFVLPRVLAGLRRASSLAETRLRRTMALGRHLRGEGIEVGAGVSPAVVPAACKVRYVDKYGADALNATPEFRGYPIRAPDILDDAQTLATLQDESQDFAIAFSLFEHLQDPIGALSTFHRVTRDGGSIVLSVPDKRRYEPDGRRPLTEFSHLVRDHEEGPQVSKEAHVREFAIARGLSGGDLEAFVEDQLASDAHVHFHVWDADRFLEFIVEARAYLRIGLEVLEFGAYGHEALVALRARR